jgi:hypothetical protein
MKIFSKFFNYLNKAKTTLILVGVVIIGYIVYNNVKAEYHTKEIKQLEVKIKDTQKLYEAAILESQKYKDSIQYYDNISKSLDSTILVQNARIQILQVEKARALKKVKDIEGFLKQRYAHIAKAGSTIAVDKNDTKEIVGELIEKDYLVQEVALLNENRDTLSLQVTTLKSSLNLAKQETSAINSALQVKIQENTLHQELNATLKKDLKKAKRRSFWNTVKGIGVGTAAGIVIGKTM